MPTSTIDQAPAILRAVSAVVEGHGVPLRVLDCGIGNGRYGLLVREILDTLHQPERWTTILDGIEIFPAYLTPVQRYVYSRVYAGDIRTLLADMPDRGYDLVLLLDVLEHFNRQHGWAVLRQVLRVAEVCIVSTPRHFFAQQAVFGNEAEVHRSIWRVQDFRLLGCAVSTLSTPGQHIVVLGGTTALHRDLRRWYRNSRLKALLPDWLTAAIFQRRTRSRTTGPH